MEKLKLPVHEHPLYRVGANYIRGNYGLRLSCNGCFGYGHMDNGFRCSQCPELYLHQKCGESALEINHPSHPQHPLKLLTGQECSDKRCHVCGVGLRLSCYHCSICDFTLDIGCAINPPPLPIIEQPEAHEHPLTLMKPTDVDFTCHICHGNPPFKRHFYVCNLCDFFFHIECASFSPEINHSCHPRHPLKFISSGSYLPRCCSICGRDTKDKNCYHCSICDFTLDLRCVQVPPPPLALVSPKTHKHQLTLMPRIVLFTCNACGLKGDRSPYVCVQCHFVIHSQCVDLPGVICINRHDHPISHTYDLDLLGSLVLECGVCRQTINPSYGAYCCLKCKNYAVHSRCATLNSGWDGRDIEGEPEEIEDVSPFKVVGNNLIKHFSHEEHDMKLVTKEESVLGGAKSCKACIKSIGPAESFYKCIQCDYILDEACANLPRKIRSLLLPEKSILVGGTSYFNDAFYCTACMRYSSGFRYINGPFEIDLQCISISEPLERESHHHPLYYFSEHPNECGSCCEQAYLGYKCLKDGCDFSLHLNCATFPERVKHKSDDHTLRLCVRGEEGYGIYWCDICEKQVDHSKQYYTCDDCRTTLHIKCVLGDLFTSISPGSIINRGEVKYDYTRMCLVVGDRWPYEFEVVSNNGINRPLCYVCHTRCTFSLVLKSRDILNKYVCSHACLTKFRALAANDH